MKVVGVEGFRGLWALKWAWQTFFCQSIGIDENNTFQLKFVVFAVCGRLSGRGKLFF